MSGQGPLQIFIVSDATGAMAESVLTSVLVQFKHHPFKIHRFPFTRNPEKVLEIIDQAQSRTGIIVFSLVIRDLRDLLLKEGKAMGLTVVDIMGPLIGILTDLLKDSPKMQPGAFRNTDQNTYRLSEAIDFTIKHDDGLGMETLHKADLIILGVSRTGKTPTSIYLSAKKIKVANIPIVRDVSFPEEVIRLPITKVGFLIKPERLAELRKERQRRFQRVDSFQYASLSHIMEERAYCKKIFRKIPSLRTIDVTNRSVEEISEWITRDVLHTNMSG